MAHYDELAMSIIYEKVLLKFLDVAKYMPRTTEGRKPPRQFFWNVFNTLHPDVVKDILQACHNKRGIDEEDKQQDEVIVIRADILDQIEAASFQPSKPFTIKRREATPSTCSRSRTTSCSLDAVDDQQLMLMTIISTRCCRNMSPSEDLHH